MKLACQRKGACSQDSQEECHFPMQNYKFNLYICLDFGYYNLVLIGLVELLVFDQFSLFLIKLRFVFKTLSSHN
jgi:hypothetical protein